MARKDKNEKSKEEKLVEQQERARTLLEKLGFAPQMMFDFYIAKVA